MSERRLCGGQYLKNWTPPLCWQCTHYREDVSCAAFPRGIPAEILDSKVDHHNSYAGDHGIHFERVAQDGDDHVTVVPVPHRKLKGAKR